MQNFSDQLRSIADRILKHLPLEDAHFVDELYDIAKQLDEKPSAADDGGSNPPPPPPKPPHT